ncbi:DUF4242 domain-containing protein [Anaeromyxobacter diazotrophicus]|uniref:DUF4242 domain-containing protein n=1 Tax=Anaeromyxobacter diazotrophicus TaxID=2590199 RepID=A0A7I9VMX1_9BACT|nr:DUF4242 domain-containing protein [Anaeromyxobacter diazotrophicus]GEJ57731.1 hypothetical protein AMYX_24720 [Anaeromyxobacter diazotrophicus]
MRKYLIEREIPGVARMSPAELRAVAQKSNGILRDLGPSIQWVQSFVTADKFYCLYYAATPELIEEHARCTGIPADRISEVVGVIDPTDGA